MNSLVRSNSFPFTKGLPTFTMINLFNFIQNLMKHKMNLNNIGVVKGTWTQETLKHLKEIGVKGNKGVYEGEKRGCAT